MAYPSCHELSNLDASCNAIQKVGGVASFVYFGSKKAWRDRYISGTPPSIAYGTINTTDYGWIIRVDVTELLGTELAKFEGVEYKKYEKESIKFILENFLELMKYFFH